MGKLIAVVSGKGGVGKTTVAAGVSCCLAALGKTVVCADADAGMGNLDVALGMQDAGALDAGDLLRDLAGFSDTLVPHESLENLRLLAAPPEQDDAVLKGMPELLRKIAGTADFCIADCPAGAGTLVREIAAAADEVIMICTPDFVSLRDAKRLAGILDGYGRIRLVINRVRPRLMSSGSAPDIDDAIDTTGLMLLGVLPEDEAIMVFSNRWKLFPLYTADGAARACLNIAQRLLGNQVPMMKMSRFID
jgi:septum site-determining protein MinD